MYCDANNDLVADVPDRPEEVEEPVDDRLHLHAGRGSGGLREDLQAVHDAPREVHSTRKSCSTRCRSNAAEIEAMRSGRLHVGGFSTGPTGVRGQPRRRDPVRHQGRREKDFQGYNLIVDREGELAVPEARRPQGQEGRAHGAVVELRPPRAARAVPGRGPRARQGLQDRSSPASTTSRCMGVDSGDYDAAAVASDVFHRMGERGQIKEDDFRIIYRSQKFPTSSFAYAHDLDPELVDKMLDVLLRLPLPAGDAEGVRRRRPLLPDQLQEGLGSGAQGRRRARAVRSTRRRYEKETARSAKRRRRSTARARRKKALMLAVRHLSKSYVAGKPVLTDINLEIARARHHRDHRPVGHRQVAR